MLSTLITKERIQLIDHISDWESSIDLLCRPLTEDGSIESVYIDSIKTTTKEIGPYYVLAPQIAMPHSRPENGVNKNALALLIVRNGVEFNSEENDPVKLLLLLAAKDSTQHLELIQAISTFFCNEDDVSKVIHAKSIDDIIETIKKY
jgi:Phosphotransferase system mannitol/fructose-specific IIA domain (Ntr-type)